MLSSPQAPWEPFMDDLQCSNMAGVLMCPVIWLRGSEAYKQHIKEFARLMCGTSIKLEMYTLMLSRWI